MRKVALVGHSYIRKLETLHRDRKIVFFYEDVRFRAWSGTNCETLTRNVVGEILTWRPDVVFLQIGGNEIRPPNEEDWQTAYKRIADFIAHFQVEGIIIRIGEVMPRPRPWERFGVTADDYSTCRNSLNTRLKRWCRRNSPRMHVLTFRLEEFSDGRTRYPDGVHLDEDGVRRYWNVIVAGCRQALGLEQ